MSKSKKKLSELKEINGKASKRKKLAELEQVDGKKESKEELSKPRTLNEVWGDDGISEYKTMDESVYSQQLTDMDTVDLQREAVKRGLLPSRGRDIITARLLVQFRKHVNSYGSVASPQTIHPNKITPEVRRILNEGR